MSAIESFRPYRGRWELADARRYFARSPGSLSVSLLTQRTDGMLDWREVSYVADAGVTAIATVVSPVSRAITHGVALAHGGSDDGRPSVMTEAAALAAQGAAVIMAATRIRLDEGVEVFATDIKNAVLTERAALDVLIEVGAPPDALSFLGHSAGGALGAILSAVEPRLARVAIFGNGAGAAARTALALALSRGSGSTDGLAPVTEWFDLAHFVSVERRARLFVQQGRADRTAPIEAGRALFDAAAQPKRWAEYDCDHALDADPLARTDRAEFVMKPEDSNAAPRPAGHA